MQRTLSIPVGILVARWALDNEWQRTRWQPVGAVLGDIGLAAGSLLRRDDEAAVFFAGTEDLVLHATDAASYRINLEQDVPRVYVVLKEREDDSGPPSIHLITAAPDEAESYLEGDACVVDGVPMPEALLTLMREFATRHAPSDADRGARRHRRQDDGAKGPLP